MCIVSDPSVYVRFLQISVFAVTTLNGMPAVWAVMLVMFLHPMLALSAALPFTSVYLKSVASSPVCEIRNVDASTSLEKLMFRCTFPVLLICSPWQPALAASRQLWNPSAELSLSVVNEYCTVGWLPDPKLTFVSTTQLALLVILRLTLPLPVARPVILGFSSPDLNKLSLLRLRMVPPRLITTAATISNANVLFDTI